MWIIVSAQSILRACLCWKCAWYTHCRRISPPSLSVVGTLVGYCKSFSPANHTMSALFALVSASAVTFCSTKQFHRWHCCAPPGVRPTRSGTPPRVGSSLWYKQFCCTAQNRQLISAAIGKQSMHQWVSVDTTTADRDINPLQVPVLVPTRHMRPPCAVRRHLPSSDWHLPPMICDQSVSLLSLEVLDERAAWPRQQRIWANVIGFESAKSDGRFKMDVTALGSENRDRRKQTGGWITE